MKTFAIYFIGFLLVGALLYVFVFFRPNANRIEDLERRIIAEEQELEHAEQRTEIHPYLLLELEELLNTLTSEEGNYHDARGSWDNRFSQFIPDVFDEEEVRRLIDGIVHPNVENLHVEINFSEPLTPMSHNDQDSDSLPRGLWMTPVSVNFTATYEGLINVLTNFADANFDNRIIGYNLESEGERWRVELRVDILTETPPRYRFNGNYAVYDGSE